MKRISASALERIYMCPGSYSLPEDESRVEAPTQAAVNGNLAHKFIEDGQYHYGMTALLPVREMALSFLREVQLWIDPMTGRSGCRLSPGPRDYEGIPARCIVGTADLIARKGNRLIVADLKTGGFNWGRNEWRSTSIAKGHRQLIMLAYAAYLLSPPKSRPEEIELMIIRLRKVDDPEVSYDTHVYKGSEMRYAFAEAVYNPLAKAMINSYTQEHVVNPSSTNCKFCTALCPSRYQERKGKK